MGKSHLDGIAVGVAVQVWQRFAHGDNPWRQYTTTIARSTKAYWVTQSGDRFRKDTGILVPRYLDYVTFIRPIDWKPTP
jgi:hypothetical protein